MHNGNRCHTYNHIAYSMYKTLYMLYLHFYPPMWTTETNCTCTRSSQHVLSSEYWMQLWSQRTESSIIASIHLGFSPCFTKKKRVNWKNCAYSFVETRHGHFMNWVNAMQCFCKSHQGNCMLGKMHALSTLIHHIHRKNRCRDSSMQYSKIEH